MSNLVPFPPLRKAPLQVTPRQAEVLEFRRRLSVADTAMVMDISVNTVKSTQRRAIKAIGAESLADAVAALVEQKRAA